MRLAAAAPTGGAATTSSIETSLASQVSLNGRAGSDVLYVVSFPKQVAAQSDCGCGGYHSEMVVGGASIPYAVAFQFPDVPSIPNVFDDLTNSASHEVVEAATDPYPVTSPAWASVGPSDYAWGMFQGQFGAELADRCNQQYDAKPADLPFSVNTVWSNTAAAAGHDPCVPARTSPFFGVIGSPPDTSFVNPSFPAAKSIHIPLGGTGRLPLTLFSEEAAVGTFHVDAFDMTQDPTTPLAQGTALAFTWDKSDGGNGDVVTLDISVVKSGTGGFESFLVGASHLDANGASANGYSMFYPVLVDSR
jgi:hypothetical protein